MSKQCPHCIYGTKINSGTTDRGGRWACGFLLFTGTRRPCPQPEDGKCPAFTQKSRVRRPKLALKGSNR